jgi:beta-lactamase regulating signal transducer with metallopeptidase domain/HEAT repeat protein
MMTVAIIGWALVHSLWQGAVIAAAFAVLLLVTKSSSPALRYWAGLTALLAMVAVPVATAFRSVEPPSATPGFVLEAPATEPGDAGAPLPVADVANENTAASAAITDNGLSTSILVSALQDAALRAMPWMVALWFVGLLLSSMRLLGGLIRTRRMTRVGVTPAGAALEARVRALAARIDLTRAVKVLESANENAPLVIGALRPVIVLPASLLTGLTPLQLDMLLVHELAHIRRNDFMTNLVQTVIDTLLFYHPAARWVSKRVREERENCCDDIAVTICGGDARAYAETLLTLEEARPDSYHLAAAARGGTLLRRVQRLIPGQPAHMELGPIWIAGVVTIAAALFTGREAVALGVHSSLIPGTRIEMAADTIDKDSRRPDPSKAAPSTVIRAPGGGSLDERWSWAERRGASLGSSYWIGYVVQGDPDATSFYYASDVPVSISNGSIQMSGSMRFMSNDAADMVFAGVRVAPLVGEHHPNSILMLFQVSQGITGRRITRTHVSTFSIPAYFFGRPLIWLDRAGDSESIEKLQAMMSSATIDAQKNIVGAIGTHTSDRLVVPVLSRLALSGSANEEVRESAIEALGREDGRLSMPVITRVARTDRSNDVRREAIQALAHLDHPAATDSLMSLVASARTLDERRVAVEALGSRDEERAARLLVGLADGSRDSEIQRQAVEALGSMSNDRGVEEIERIARTAASSETRSAAVEAISSWDDTSRALSVLNEIVRADPQEQVRVAAVEAIASVHDIRAIDNLRDIATRGEAASVRIRAVEALGSTRDDARALAVLKTLAERHPEEDVRVLAMETMVDMKGTGTEYIESVIRGSEPQDLRLRVLEIYADHADRARAVTLLRSVVQGDRSEEMRLRALDLLGDLDSRGMEAVREFARTSTNPVIRDRAREIIASH